MQRNKVKTASELHAEIFGVDPVITGINAMGERSVDELIIETIDNGIPYVEKEPIKGALY